MANGDSKRWFAEQIAKNGPWCAIAVALAFGLWITTIKPSAAERESIRADRQKLIDAVTVSLERNSESMAKMSLAVENLNDTLSAMQVTQEKTQELQKQTNITLETFAEKVHGCHEKQNVKLGEIKDKLDST